jgi:hypothetical protein
VWLASVLMLMIFHYSKAKTFCLSSFLARKKSRFATPQGLFLSVQESLPNKKFLLEDDENFQHQHKGKPHTQEKSQDAATSIEDANADTMHIGGVEKICVFN